MLADVGPAMVEAFTHDEAQRLLASESQRLGCAVADPIRGGAAFDALVMACLA